MASTMCLYTLVVSLSNHELATGSSFDKLRTSGAEWDSRVHGAFRLVPCALVY
jgi:hypothetical protein